MWPLAWSAETETKSMMFGSDDVVYTSRGTTYYMLDKNWKRSDTTTYKKGTLFWFSNLISIAAKYVLPMRLSLYQ